MQENSHPYEITDRTVAYSLELIRFYRSLERDEVAQILGRQLLRAGTSVGANVHEAQGGQSRADFISKMSIAHKEAREAAYWLRLFHDGKICSEENLSSLMDETGQLVRILSSIILNTKGASQQCSKDVSSGCTSISPGPSFLHS